MPSSESDFVTQIVVIDSEDNVVGPFDGVRDAVAFMTLHDCKQVSTTLDPAGYGGDDD